MCVQQLAPCIDKLKQTMFILYIHAQTKRTEGERERKFEV